MDKSVNLIEVLTKEVPGLLASADANSMSDFILVNCEKNEGLQKLYSFHTLLSIMTQFKSMDNEQWL